MKTNSNLLLLLILLPRAFAAHAQEKTLSLDTVLNTAYANNKNLKAVSLQKEYYQLQRKTATALPKTDVNLQYGQYNGFYKKDNSFTVSQSIPFPSVFGAKASLAEAQVKGAEWQAAVSKNELTLQVRQVYYQLVYWHAYQRLLESQDSLYRNLSSAAALRHSAGDASLLEKTTAEMRLSELQVKKSKVEAEVRALYLQLNSLMGTMQSFTIEQNAVEMFAFRGDSSQLRGNPALMYAQQQVHIAEKERSVLSQSALPDFRIGYFNQSLYGVPLNDAGTQLAGPNNRFQGVQVGIAFPLWFLPESNRTKAAKTQVMINRLNYEQEKLVLRSHYNQTLQQFETARANLQYYQNTALPNARLIERQSRTAFEKGEIAYTAHLLNLQQAMSIHESYLTALSDYNQTAIYLEYLIAQ